MEEVKGKMRYGFRAEKEKADSEPTKKTVRSELQPVFVRFWADDEFCRFEDFLVVGAQARVPTLHGMNRAEESGVKGANELVGGDGAGAGPFADGGDVFTASDAEGLRGGKFTEKNLGGELLFDGEGCVEAGDDGLFDFGAGKAVAGGGERGKIE